MNLSDIRDDYLMPELGGANAALVDLHLRRVIIDFCDKTGIYTELVTPINIVAGDYTYSLTPATAGMSVVRAWSVWYGTRRLHKGILSAVEDALKRVPEPGLPTHYTSVLPGEILVYPVPAESLAGGLTARLWLRPADDVTAIADWLGERYLDAFAAGAKARLMSMAEKPWSNADQAMMYRGEYMSARSDAKIEAYRSFEMAEQQVEFRKV